MTRIWTCEAHLTTTSGDCPRCDHELDTLPALDDWSLPEPPAPGTGPRGGVA